MHSFYTRQALNGTRVETDWNMRADTRKLVASINKANEGATPMRADGRRPVEAFPRKDGNGIHLRIGMYDMDIDRHGNLLGHGWLMLDHVDQKDLLAPKPRAKARSTICNASSSPRPKT